MDTNIEDIHRSGLDDLKAARTSKEVQDLTVRYLGRKGILTQFLRNFSQLPAEQRPAAGKKANQLKGILEREFKTAIQKFESADSDDLDRIDVSLPGRPLTTGYLHPITQVNDQICDIFSSLGFDIAEGPEVESDYYNFEALNFPKDHPARDMQDTFFVNDDVVLRTHT